MKELFNKLSNISQFFKEKRLVYKGVEKKPPPEQPKEVAKMGVLPTEEAKKTIAKAGEHAKEWKAEKTKNQEKKLSEARDKLLKNLFEAKDEKYVLDMVHKGAGKYDFSPDQLIILKRTKKIGESGHVGWVLINPDLTFTIKNSKGDILEQNLHQPELISFMKNNPLEKMEEFTKMREKAVKKALQTFKEKMRESKYVVRIPKRSIDYANDKAKAVVFLKRGNERIAVEINVKDQRVSFEIPSKPGEPIYLDIDKAMKFLENKSAFDSTFQRLKRTLRAYKVVGDYPRDFIYGIGTIHLQKHNRTEYYIRFNMSARSMQVMDANKNVIKEDFFDLNARSNEELIREAIR